MKRVYGLSSHTLRQDHHVVVVEQAHLQGADRRPGPDTGCPYMLSAVDKIAHAQQRHPRAREQHTPEPETVAQVVFGRSVIHLSFI